MSDERVKKAFNEVREGRSPEHVVCDPTLNERFLKAARQLGLNNDDAKLNTELINLTAENLSIIAQDDMRRNRPNNEECRGEKPGNDKPV